MEEKDEFMKNFIHVGELRKMLSDLDDDEWITVSTFSDKIRYHRIKHVEDSIYVAFWELICE